MGVAWIGFMSSPSNYILQCYQHNYPFIKTTYYYCYIFFPRWNVSKMFSWKFVCIKQVLWWLWKKYKIKYNNNTIIAIRILDLVDQTTNKVFNLKEFLSPMYKSFLVWLMCSSCHTPNVLIGVEYRNCCLTMDVYLRFAIWIGKIQSKFTCN